MTLNMRLVDTACILLLIVAMTMGGWFMHKKVVQSFTRITLEKEQLAAEKNRLDTVSTTFRHLDSNLKKADTQFQELNNKVPNIPKIGDFLTAVHDRIKGRKLTLVDFNHTPPQNYKIYKFIPVRLIVKGDFINIYGLIHDLETLTRVFVFEKIVIQRDEAKNQCQAVLMAKVFQQ